MGAGIFRRGVQLMTKFVLVVYSPDLSPHPTKQNASIEHPNYEVFGPFKTEQDASAWLQWYYATVCQCPPEEDNPPKIVELKRPQKRHINVFGKD
jgi:hypothetical protein